ncbi:MAG: hypothetical protein R2867_36945 [Caldilineaceae bacterium]
MGQFYRLLVDLTTAGVLVGMIYFLLRRFVFGAPALNYRSNVKLHEKVTGAIRRDSLIVAFLSYCMSASGCSATASMWRNTGPIGAVPLPRR